MPSTESLSENGRGLAHFAMPCEQNVPVPLSADRFRIGSKDHPPDPIQRELDHQNRNPAKLLTSGPERPRKIRSSRAERFGTAKESSGGENTTNRKSAFLVTTESCRATSGRGNAFCVDYAVGKRHLERLKGGQPLKTKLAAIRLPERQVVFDDGTTEMAIA